ncbi:CheB methylesterase domain-containing protein [Rufibacter sp. LB8]|uniref:CheB methylesterase domain-containing protein n=1 Tax=Rufibacter sp. LB8 TaxID=2777781 RepID=UPI00178C259C|nr:CheB methylesterase domain-containing protein [Rufibacter sp. LB8]
MLEAEPYLEVVDTAQTREELLFKAITYQPDVILSHPDLTLSGNLPSFHAVFGKGTSNLLLVSQKLAQGNPLWQENQMQVIGTQGYQLTRGEAGPEGQKAGLLAQLRSLAFSFIKSRANSVVKALPLKVASFETGPSFSLPGFAVPPLCVVVVGASTGGSAAVEHLIKDLEVPQPTVVLVAVHMPEKFTKRLAKRLQKITQWRVEEGYQGMVLTPQTVIIAPGGMNMQVRRNALRPEALTLHLSPATALDSPSVDVLMKSAAVCAQSQVMGVIMTGMGQDGTEGAKAIRQQGGVVIAQNKATSSIFGMAKSAIESGAVNGVFALGQINSIIGRFVTDRNRRHILQSNLIG